ncbi:unnamed protein product [Ceutorhynchus assimilis]|uniref:Uncharacterized protein n=1 Tax=Ceutorhynchus assimilis TaxID=467358 RepID=A0A9N9MQV9_9CUCU|nr:unnamed protein product [Ceutorhynchus assimilis]
MMTILEDLAIPPNHIGHVNIASNESNDYNGEVFVEFGTRLKQSYEYCIPRCITYSQNGVLPVMNLSCNLLDFKAEELFTRGTPCLQEKHFVNEKKYLRRETTPKNKVFMKKTFLQKEDFPEQRVHEENFPWKGKDSPEQRINEENVSSKGKD